MYKVKSGDNMYTISKEYDINVDDLLTLNGLNKNDYIYPNQEIMVPTGLYNFYITKNNDTIKTILENTNLPIEEIINQNDNIYLVPDQLIIYKKNNI